MSRVRVATVWLDACAGCHMSFLDMDEALAELVKQVEFTRSPLTDIKEFSPVEVGIVEGAVGNTHDEEVLKKLRANSRILMAWGDCACFGGISSMRNLFKKQDVLRRCFIESESTKGGKIPSSEELPSLLEEVRPPNRVVRVDCYVPGCPPPANVIHYALKELLQGRIPVLPSEMMRFD